MVTQQTLCCVVLGYLILELFAPYKLEGRQSTTDTDDMEN